MRDLPVIALEGVSKRFNDIYALRDISVTVRGGEVFCLLGPTGAGKSTLVRLLVGFLQPDEGVVALFGATDPQLARSRLGYMPENPRYHPSFSGRDYLYFHARLSGMTRSGARKAVDHAIERVGLGPVARRKTRYYERETLQRLGLAVAMVSVMGGPPGLLVLDEPSDYLSRAVQLTVRDVILEQKKQGMTVLIASHRITEVERAATSVGILRGGRLVAHTQVENNPRVIIVAAPRESAPESNAGLLTHLHNLHPFVTVTGGGSAKAPIVISLPSGPHIMNAAGIKASAMRALLDASWDVISVHVERKDLESIYLQSAPPRPQVNGGMATGPLRNVTGPLDPMLDMAGSMITSPTGLSAAQLAARNTRPLQASERGFSLPGEPAGNGNNGSNGSSDSPESGHGGEYGEIYNAHRPIEGRAIRGGQE
jgi:ABC-2 type transport system ATP-binding protein